MLENYSKTNYKLQFAIITGLEHAILYFKCNKNFYTYDSNDKSAIKCENILESYKCFKYLISNKETKQEYLDMKRGKMEIYFFFMDIDEIIKEQPYSELNEKHIDSDSPIDLYIDDPLPSEPTYNLKTKQEKIRKTLANQKSFSTVSKDVKSILPSKATANSFSSTLHYDEPLNTLPTLPERIVDENKNFKSKVKEKISTSDIKEPLSCSQSFYNFISRLTKYNKRSRIGVAGGYSLILSKVYSKKKK
jgi:hypothetical protein